VTPIVSIVVPAHDEASVIAEGLQALLDGTEPGEFDVVVVANACSDSTAVVAGGFGVRVLETPVPGKAHALRLGDAECRTFPRIYLDADVVLPADAVRRLVDAAARPGVLACAPRPELDLTGAGPMVRSLHKVHDALMTPHRGLAGAGVYLLTEAGHARAFPVPDVISDDGWVHGTFQPDERVVVPDARSVVRPPRTIAAHLRRRIRVRQGNRELAGLGRAPAEGKLTLGALGGLVRRRTVSVPDAASYLAVLLLDRALTRVRRDVHWGTDASSRSARA